MCQKCVQQVVIGQWDPRVEVATRRTNKRNKKGRVWRNSTSWTVQWWLSWYLFMTTGEGVWTRRSAHWPLAACEGAQPAGKVCVLSADDCFLSRCAAGEGGAHSYLYMFSADVPQWTVIGRRSQYWHIHTCNPTYTHTTNKHTRMHSVYTYIPYLLGVPSTLLIFLLQINDTMAACTK